MFLIKLVKQIIFTEKFTKIRHYSFSVFDFQALRSYFSFNFFFSISDLFQKLFRQDLLVASLFRNYLLAERIMRSYDCTPVSCPKLPSTFQHPMWQAWDLSLDLCVSQLPAVLECEESYCHSPFFEEQLTAFQVWLDMGSDSRSPPEQLPIVLQVLKIIFLLISDARIFTIGHSRSAHLFGMFFRYQWRYLLV